MKHPLNLRRFASLVGFVCYFCPPSASCQGLATSGVGPVNQSMAGAATACPIDASGALMWNPATISGLSTSEVSFAVGILFPETKLASTVEAGAFGPGQPPVGLSGSTDSVAGTSAVPYAAFVERVEGSAWTYGVGVFGVGGFRVNYPSSGTNPIVMPPPPSGFGLGTLTSDVEILQIAPTVSYSVSDRLSFGLAPTVSIAKVGVSPVLFASPNDANGDGYPSYPDGRGSRSFWGGGFQCGVYYIGDEGWHYGVAAKSPQWFEDVRFYTEDELGRSQSVKVPFAYPAVVSGGVAYSGLDRWLLATDLRLFDFANADGFRQTGYDEQGALRGLGWSSVLAISCGAQYQANDLLYLRTGYSFNQNPISDADSGFNVASPGILQHFVYCGATVQLSHTTYLSAAYVHGFENSISGPMQLPTGQAPGTSVTSISSLDALTVGIAVKY